MGKAHVAVGRNEQPATTTAEVDQPRIFHALLFAADVGALEVVNEALNLKASRRKTLGRFFGVKSIVKKQYTLLTPLFVLAFQCELALSGRFRR